MKQRRFEDLDTQQLKEVDRICAEFEAARGPDHNSIEQNLSRAPEHLHDVLFGELLAFELELKGQGELVPDQAGYLARFPDRQDQVKSAFDRVFPDRSESNRQLLTTSGDPEVEAEPSEDSTSNTELPEAIGRFKVEREIGRGGFGVVYKAHDDRLKRNVAIKVPRSRFLSRNDTGRSFLAEARVVADLDHPNIVPVYELGNNESFPLFIVTKYIAGNSLATKVGPKQIGDPLASAELIAKVASALQYAHQQGLVHRDVKPGNILIDQQGQPHLTDFGLAIRDDDFGKGIGHSGTPAYMSPEQAQGEAHRVDGRSDVFSLGIVLYELLVGRRPFRGSNRKEIMENVATCRPRPLRQFEPKIPKELERICLKAMSKRVSQRYLTALDMATDLQDFLANTAVLESPSFYDSAESSTPKSSNRNSSDRSSNSSSATPPESTTVSVIPKGLRSFDDHDKDFFLELLPGPRDRDGLPDSLRFWKSRIEETDRDKTFSVGLIYGPSGCGKSSLVKAGLLPQLSSGIDSVYVEATATDTESNILNHLRKHIPDLPQDLDLSQSIAELRRNSSLPEQKVLIVIDQFEQWLHVNKEMENVDLLRALRQCDGEHVQCILMVRDDFWLSISRMMQQLDIDLVPGRNISLVDLFDRDHARKVLTAFGVAFGKIPGNSKARSKSQKEFLKQSVEELSQDGKVVCVRLTLFAEMLKAKSWELATLKAIGGTQAVGVEFLNETFASSAANPSCRFHRKAAQRVLKALLPDSGTDIKGRMRSGHELLEISGYRNQPEQFEALIRILDSDLRLITPTEVVESEADDDDSSPISTSFYQLTHDYLVHSLRQWLTKSQRETRRGRAELRLTERTKEWQSQPTSRYLPAWWEYANIRLFTRKNDWSSAQQKLMRRARNYHGFRWSTGLVALLVIAISVQYYLGSLRLKHQTDQIATAITMLTSSSGTAVPRAIADLDQYPQNIVVEKLCERTKSANKDENLVLSYALAKYGLVDVKELIEQVPFVHSREMENLFQAMSYSKADAVKAVRHAFERLPEDENNTMPRLAILALHLGDLDLAQNMCAIGPDPGKRTLFIEQFSKWHADVAEFAQIAQLSQHPDFQSAMCLAIGSINRDQLTQREQEIWQEVSTELYLQSPASVVHSAAGWLLRQWELDLPEIRITQGLTDGRKWHVNTFGMTMIEIPTGKFTPTKAGNQDKLTPHLFLEDWGQEVEIAPGFLMSDREVSVKQYQKVVDDTRLPTRERPYLYYKEDEELQESAGLWVREDVEISPTSEHPVQMVSWIEAVMFCNCLSRQEGFTPCYERTGKVWDQPRTNPQNPPSYEEWRLRPDADGYRLPTVAEWEWACAAKSTTKFSFGNNPQWLSLYAVADEGSAQICGSKLPNGWGLFDMHGSVRELCSDVVAPDWPEVHDYFKRIAAKGGDWNEQRNYFFYTNLREVVSRVHLSSEIGFRVVRSLK